MDAKTVVADGKIILDMIFLFIPRGKRKRDKGVIAKFRELNSQSKDNLLQQAINEYWLPENKQEFTSFIYLPLTHPSPPYPLSTCYFSWFCGALEKLSVNIGAPRIVMTPGVASHQILLVPSAKITTVQEA